MVKVKLFANLREATNGRRVVEYDVDGSVSATELLQGLVEKYGDKARKRLLSPDGGPWPTLVIMRNGRLVRDKDEKTIAAGDEVAVLLPVAGG